MSTSKFQQFFFPSYYSLQLPVLGKPVAGEERAEILMYGILLLLVEALWNLVLDVCSFWVF